MEEAQARRQLMPGLSHHADRGRGRGPHEFSRLAGYAECDAIRPFYPELGLSPWDIAMYQ